MNSCPKCAGAARPWLTVPCDWRRPTDSQPYQLYWCDPCAFGFLSPRPTLEQCAAFYDFDEYYTHHPGEPADMHDRTFLGRVREHLAWRLDGGRSMSADYFRALLGPAPLRICDIGCGSGDLATQFRDLGHQVIGVEIDPAAREVARSRGLEVHRGTAEHLPEPVRESRFDVLVLSHVLEHCIDPRAALRSARSILRDGGRLFCEVPNNACLALRRLGVTWSFLDAPRHLSFFTASSLVGMAEQCGFAVQRVEFAGGNRQFFRERLETEARIHDVLKQATPDHRLPPRHNRWRAWLMLAQFALSPRERRYDSVRIVASPLLNDAENVRTETAPLSVAR